MIFTTCSNGPRIVFLISSGNGMRTMTTQELRQRFGGTRVRLERLVPPSETRIFTVSRKLSSMLVLLHHGKQNIFSFVPHLSVPQLHTQQHLVLWVPKARYRSI